MNKADKAKLTDGEREQRKIAGCQWSQRVRSLSQGRANGVCEECGGKSSRWVRNTNGYGLTGHHIVYKSNGGVDNEGNIKILCADCRDKIHYGR